MALDYTMMRDAVNMDAMNRLSRAQAIGESAGALGFLGANAINEQGGLMQMFNNAKYKMNKPKYDAMYQQGLEDNPWLEGDQTDNFWNEVDAMSNVPGGKELVKSLSSEGVSEEIPGALDELYSPKEVISPEPTGNMTGGSYNMLPDGTFEFMPADDSSITMYNRGDQPGVDQGVTPQMLPQEPIGPINTALANEQGIGTVSAVPPISTSNLQPIDSVGVSPDVNTNMNNQQGPLMGLINKGKGALGLNKDEYGRNYWDKLRGYIGGDNIAPWDPYYKDPYYDLEFDENDRLISDTKYGGLTKDQLNLDYPTYGWTTDARLGRSPSFFSDEIQNFRQGN